MRFPQTTFSSLDHVFGSDSGVKELARVSYLDLSLRWFGRENNNNRKLVFGHLAKAGHVTLG